MPRIRPSRRSHSPIQAFHPALRKSPLEPCHQGNQRLLPGGILDQWPHHIAPLYAAQATRWWQASRSEFCRLYALYPHRVRFGENEADGEPRRQTGWALCTPAEGAGTLGCFVVSVHGTPSHWRLDRGGRPPCPCPFRTRPCKSRPFSPAFSFHSMVGVLAKFTESGILVCSALVTASRGRMVWFGNGLDWGGTPWEREFR